MVTRGHLVHTDKDWHYPEVGTIDVDTTTEWALTKWDPPDLAEVTHGRGRVVQGGTKKAKSDPQDFADMTHDKVR